MVGGSSIRRLWFFARRHLWDGAVFAVFAAALVMGAGPVMAGAGKFLMGLAPAMPAEASDQPARAGIGVARLPMVDFAPPSRYPPQLLYPVQSHPFPDWLIRAAAHATPPWVQDTSAIGLPPRSVRPVIAICIDDLGEDLAGTDKAMALPKQVALSFLPYAEPTPFLAEEAEAQGHLVLAHVPMQALSDINPGPMALTVGAPDLAARIAWNIARVPGLAGINNHEGSRFTQDAASLQPVMQALAARHLFFFDSRTIAGSQGLPVARHFGVTGAGRDIFLDDTVSAEEVRRQLEALVAVAKRQGAAIAIGHPHDVTLKILAAWLAEDHGVTLVPLDEAIRRKGGIGTMALK